MSTVIPADDTSLRFPTRSTERAWIVYPPAAGGFHVHDHGVDVPPTVAGATVNQVSVEDQALPVHQLPVAVCCTEVSIDGHARVVGGRPTDRDGRQRDDGAVRGCVERHGGDLRIGGQPPDEDVADDVRRVRGVVAVAVHGSPRGNRGRTGRRRTATTR